VILPTLRFCVSSLALAGAVFALDAPAAADTTTYGDVTAGAGYSSNPLQQINGHSSGFGRLSVFGLHSWRSATGSSTVSAYGENTSYLRDYGSTQIFYVKGHTEQQLSPTASIFGDLNFSGDFAGQLSNRLTNVPSQPPVTQPGNPLPPTNNTPDAFGLSGREYRLDGHVGTSIRTGPRGTLSASIGAERLMFGGDNGRPSYNIYLGSLGYSHQVSERAGLGGTVYLQRQDFQGGDYANIANPTLTANILLSETLTAKAGAGVLLIHEHRQGFDNDSTAASFSGELCNVGANSRLCGRIARDAQSALGTPLGNQTGRTALTTTASADYFRRLSANETVQASLSAVRYSGSDGLADEKFSTTYVSAVVGYDRKVGRRFYTGVSAGARKLSRPGTDPDTDLNGYVYLRYHLGSGL
jgi:hypothetical protein